MDHTSTNTAGDRESLLRVRSTKKDLHDLLNNLAVKLTEVSSNVDKEFLSSYRVHMLSIQNEIKNLKQDVIQGEQDLNSDVEVAKLETEVKWFADECNRLTSHQIAMENDIKQMEDRMASLLEQKIYLGDQLKSIMKRNRVLKAEIEYASQYAKNQTEAQHCNLDTEERSTTSSQHESTGGGSRKETELRRMSSSKTRLGTSKSMPNFSRTKSRGGRPPSSQAQLVPSQTWSNLPKSPYAVLSPIDRGGTGTMPGSGLLECSSNLQEERQSEKNKKLLDELLASKSPVEEHLERTVSEIFTELKNRKNEAAKRASIKRFPEIYDEDEEAALDPNYDPYLQIHPVIYTAGGLTGLGLQQFADNDRFSVIVKFLMDRNVFEEVAYRLGDYVIE